MKIKMGAKELVEIGRKGSKAPASKRWSRFGKHYLPGWGKKKSDAERHAALEHQTRQEGCVRVIRKLTQLRNVTADRATELRAKRDAAWLHNQGFCKLKTKK